MRGEGLGFRSFHGNSHLAGGLAKGRRPKNARALSVPTLPHPTLSASNESPDKYGVYLPVPAVHERPRTHAREVLKP